MAEYPLHLSMESTKAIFLFRLLADAAYRLVDPVRVTISWMTATRTACLPVRQRGRQAPRGSLVEILTKNSKQANQCPRRIFKAS